MITNIHHRKDVHQPSDWWISRTDVIYVL